MEKEPIKLRLSTVINIILIIILLIAIGLLVAYSHREKQADLEKINSLEANLAQLENQVNELKTNSTNTSSNTSTQTPTTNSTNTTSGTTTATQPKLGNYTIEHPTTEDETGISNEECGITLQSNNKFSLYMGFGAYLKGSYSIQNNQIIAKAIERTDPLTESKTVEVNFTFTVLAENRLKLTAISGKDATTDKVLFREGIQTNMTYTIK